MQTNLNNICIERHLWQGKPINKLVHLLTLNHSMKHCHSRIYSYQYSKYSDFKISEQEALKLVTTGKMMTMI